MRLRNCRGSFDVFRFFLVKKVCFKVVSHISRSEFITHSSILPIKILFLASMSSFLSMHPTAVHGHVLWPYINMYHVRCHYDLFVQLIVYCIVLFR